MTQADDKGFFDRLGEILNAPLPGTRQPTTQSQAAAEEDDDDSLLERIKDILNAPLPGTGQAQTTGESGSDAPAGAQAQAPRTYEKTPQIDEDELDESWWQQDWAAFRAHQERERNGLDSKQHSDQEKFLAYQAQEKGRFEGHQQQELDAFTRQQHWRLNAWKQAVANNPGQKPPPPPWDMPPGGQMPPPMSGPMGGAPPWMHSPGAGRRR